MKKLLNVAKVKFACLMCKEKNFMGKLSIMFLAICSMANRVFADDIWSMSESGGTNLAKGIAALYCHWFLPLLIVSVIAFLIVKDDKAKALCKKELIGVCAAFVICLIISADTGIFENTLGKISEWFGGSSSVTGDGQ